MERLVSKYAPVNQAETGLTLEGLIQLIPKEKAANLTNKTVIFPHDEQRRYAVEVDVFHQLHCLVSLFELPIMDDVKNSVEHDSKGDQAQLLYSYHS